MNRTGVLAMLLASTAPPDRQELSDDLDCFDIFEWVDEGILVVSFQGSRDPGWYGAVDIEPPPLEERLKMIAPREPPRLREVHGPPPRVLGRKDYLRPRFRRY